MKSLLTQRQIPILVVIQSLLVAFFIDTGCMNEILRTYGVSETGSLMTSLYMVIILAIIIVGYFQKKTSHFHMGGIPTMILLYIAASYGMTISTGGDPYVDSSHLLVFTVCAFIIPFIAEIDSQLTLKAIMFYPVLGINRISMIFVFISDWNDWISMGLSYAFYTPIVASIVYMFSYYHKEDKLNRIISIGLFFINMTYLFMIFQFGSRGPIVLSILLIVFLLSVRMNKNKLGVSINKTLIIIFSIAGIIIANSFDFILKVLLGILTNFGMTSHTISKNLQLYSEGDVDHGRNEILSKSWEGFLDSPFWGNGLDCFHQNTGIVFPHNFLMQVLYDGGLLLFFLILVPFWTKIFKLYKHCDNQLYGVLGFFIFAGMGRGVFSGDMWKLPLLWMSFGFVFSKTFIYKKHE